MNEQPKLGTDFCQWCYDQGLRYSRPGPWGHSIECPNNPNKDERDQFRAELIATHSARIAELVKALEKIAKIGAAVEARFIAKKALATTAP